MRLIVEIDGREVKKGMHLMLPDGTSCEVLDVTLNNT